MKQTQDAKWAANLAAARQFHAREGHLRVPRDISSDSSASLDIGYSNTAATGRPNSPPSGTAPTTS
ncbi:hypothetical protein [Streptomyces sp. Wh19]|uniref:Uncharacterized protein n=1 Tax=Streptomyces sanglieri TaxID=193460 RepID=A0ABW2X6U0_9ACTN|nr:hypothetical protein [Streptomyces sp. Wh19]MDV9200961.1 hypothetical protein [Streptomyces sp. Wh19]